MNLIRKLKRHFEEKKAKKEKEKLKEQMNAPCNCKYCKKKENTQMMGKYSDIKKTND